MTVEMKCGGDFNYRSEPKGETRCQEKHGNLPEGGKDLLVSF